MNCHSLLLLLFLLELSAFERSAFEPVAFELLLFSLLRYNVLPLHFLRLNFVRLSVLCLTLLCLNVLRFMLKYKLELSAFERSVFFTLAYSGSFDFGFRFFNCGCNIGILPIFSILILPIFNSSGATVGFQLFFERIKVVAFLLYIFIHVATPMWLRGIWRNYPGAVISHGFALCFPMFRLFYLAPW